MGTYIVGATILCIIGFAARGAYKDYKSGKDCGHDCENCSCCHSFQKTENPKQPNCR